MRRAADLTTTKQRWWNASTRFTTTISRSSTTTTNRENSARFDSPLFRQFLYWEIIASRYWGRKNLIGIDVDYDSSIYVRTMTTSCFIRIVVVKLHDCLLACIVWNIIDSDDLLVTVFRLLRTYPGRIMNRSRSSVCLSVCAFNCLSVLYVGLVTFNHPALNYATVNHRHIITRTVNNASHNHPTVKHVDISSRDS